MPKHIAIFDHVGKKAGMDYYSSALAKGLISHNVHVSVYSNFIGISSNTIRYKAYFQGHVKDNSIIRLAKLSIGIIKSSYDAKKRGSSLVILRLFSANIVSLLLVMIPKLFTLKTAIIAHDISSFTNKDNTIIQHLIYNTLSNHIIVHNKFSYDELLKYTTINNKNKVTCIKHGGYLDYIKTPLSKQEARKALGLKEDTKYILFFGQIKEVKGLDILLEAMSKLPSSITLIIAGKPYKSDFSKYDSLIHHYNLSDRVIKMIRFIEDDEREKLFFAVDINILPYRRIYPSGVLLMAMSHSLAVIASDLSPNKEVIIDKQNGFLFESENATNLAQTIIYYFENTALQKTIAHEAFSSIKNNYNWNDIAKKYLCFLDKK